MWGVNTPYIRTIYSNINNGTWYDILPLSAISGPPSTVQTQERGGGGSTDLVTNANCVCGKKLSGK